MKALAACALLGLAFTSEDNEFFHHKPIPIVKVDHADITGVYKGNPVRENTDIKNGGFLVKPKPVYMDDNNDNEFFQNEEMIDEDVILGIKFIKLLEKMNDDDFRNIFFDSSDYEDHFFAAKNNGKPASKKSNVHYEAESFVGDTVKIVKRRATVSI